jgi:alpha-1,2-mannosyltransferase
VSRTDSRSSRIRAIFDLPVVSAVIPGLLALGVCLWQLSLRGVLNGVTEFDDGVYLGAALRLVTGALPYRDYVFVQPPGIVILMSPVALIGRLAGSEYALEIARVITAFVTAIDSILVGWLVRKRGRAAVLVSGTALALFPLAVTADHTLKLEPYLVLFVLLGAVVTFGGAPNTLPRLFVAGTLLGIAGSIKLWAIFPMIALLVSFVPSWRRILMLVAGSCVGFGIICLPFLILAPQHFVHEVLADQLIRTSSVLNAVPISKRFIIVTGLLGLTSLPSSPTLAVLLLFALVVALGITFGFGQGSFSRVDMFLVLAAISSITAVLLSPGFYAYYSFFTAPFLAALVGIAVSGVGYVLKRSLKHQLRVPWEPVLIKALSTICAVGLFVGVLGEVTRFASDYLSHSDPTDLNGIPEPASFVDHYVSSGACVVYDSPVLAIEADRYLSPDRNCPVIVDPYGMWLAEGGGKTPPDKPPYPGDFVSTWKSYLERARYAVFSTPKPEIVPFDQALTHWFRERYRLVGYEPGVYVYVRVRGRP